MTGEFPTQRPVTQSFDAFFDLRLNKRLSKHREAGDLRRYRAHNDVIVMIFITPLTPDMLDGLRKEREADIFQNVGQICRNVIIISDSGLTDMAAILQTTF